MVHIIDIRDLHLYETKDILASSSSEFKKLYMHTKIALREARVYFTVYCKDEKVLETSDLNLAIFVYNSIK